MQAGKLTRQRRRCLFGLAIPEHFREMGSLDFCKYLITEAKVAVSPGMGFGEGGDDYVRFALVENEHRIRQAAAGIKRVFGRV